MIERWRCSTQKAKFKDYLKLIMIIIIAFLIIMTVLKFTATKPFIDDSKEICAKELGCTDYVEFNLTSIIRGVEGSCFCNNSDKYLLLK